MRAGRLRNRLILQSQVETRDDTGGYTLTWATEATVWGGIEPLSGKEYTAIRQTQDEASVRIVLRYYSGLDETWRVVNGGRAYSIVSVINENDRDRMITLMCLQGVKEAGDMPSIGVAPFAVLDADGNSFNAGLIILDAAGNSFTVGAAVLDADGNSFTAI